MDLSQLNFHPHMAAASSSLGPECAKHGLTLSDILAGRVKELPSVTNQLILELLTFKDATLQVE